jgi:hypothetical protein
MVKKKPFRIFPNSLARDAEINCSLLVYLAYRATFVGPYVSREGCLKYIVSRGFGKNAARVVISEANRRGLIERKQKNHGGEFGPLHETLHLPPCGASGRAGRIVFRGWFDGTLTVNEMAGLLFLRAGTSKGRASPRELAERFGWTEQKARKVIASLERRGLVDRIKTRRAANGRYQATAYTVPRLSGSALRRSETGASGDSDHVKSAGNGSAGNGNAGNIHTLNPSYSLPSEETPKHTRGHCIASASRQQMTCESDADAEEQAWASRKLLAWVGDDTRSEFLRTEEVDGDILDDVTAAASDASLRDALRQATGGRIGPELLSAGGLYAVRWLAAKLVEQDAHEPEPIEPVEALLRILRAIQMRIGNRGERLNSLALIGRRIAGAAYYGYLDECFYTEHERPRSRAVRK